jgi:chromosomal replication initiator protein
MESVAIAVARVFRTSPEILRSKSRKKEVQIPRNLAMYLQRKWLGETLKLIGAYFHRDPSTAQSNITRAEKLAATNLAIQAQIHEIESQFSANQNAGRGE